MMANLKYWLKGLAVAATSMIVYAVALGCYMALMLLVISMEEGGDNLSALSVPLTEAMVLLSQGSGFKDGAIVLTITPLLLTMSVIALVASLGRRFGTSLRGLTSGLLFWELMNAFFAHAVNVELVDSIGLLLAKTAVVFLIGYAIAAVPQSAFIRERRDWLAQHISMPVRKTLVIGTVLGLLLLTCYLVAGAAAVVYWIVDNQTAIVKLYALSGMQTGSRILTTISALAWLPNLVVWAVSWLFGAGFSIGDLASFSLWSGQGSSLPALPLFGMLPSAVETDWIRITLLCVPLAVSFIAGMVVMLFNKGFRFRFKGADDDRDAKRVALRFAYPAGAFCISCAVVSLCASALFSISNGALGTKHLARVGVDVIASARKVGQPTAVGLFSSWLLMLVVMFLYFGTRLAVRRFREGKSGKSVSNSEEDNRESTGVARTVVSSINNKEEQGDNNLSTDTTGSGISLP
ncbi:MAG TPA: hypothetical protein DCO66_05125 [Bifidobacterium sp.]|nr:hypothetical protein [Bifidobacterium sp.]